MLTAVTLTAASRKVETKKGKKVDFSRLCIKRQKAEKYREIFLSRFFVISELYILLKKVGSLYVEDKS